MGTGRSGALSLQRLSLSRTLSSEPPCLRSRSLAPSPLGGRFRGSGSAGRFEAAMTQQLRQRALLAWAHFYFLLTFRWWYGTLSSFSSEGWGRLETLPVWGLDWLPRLPESGVALLLELLILLSLWGMFDSLVSRNSASARRLLWPLLLAKLYFYGLDLRLFTTYHHMHLLLVLLLALGASRFWLQLALAQIYFFSALGKLNDSWLKGHYFQSINDGLPLLGESPILLLACSWAVIALEFLGPLLWFTSWAPARRASLYAFLVFHLYSGFIVGFRYPLLMLPLWYLVLWPLERPVQQNFQSERSGQAAALVLGFTFVFAWWPALVPSDVRYTAEGRYFSIGNMFDASRSTKFEVSFEKDGSRFRLQVNRTLPRYGFYDAATEVLLSQDGSPFRHLTAPLQIGETTLSPSYFREAHLRLIGDPYLYLYFLKRLQADRFDATLVSALNGGKEVLVFELRDELPTYNPGARNDWVHDE